jgi:hypothetical protein
MTASTDGITLPPMIGTLQRNKAFVIQFAPDVDIEAGRLEGRVEHVASSNWVHFHSLDELLAFLDRILSAVRANACQPFLGVEVN